MPEPAPIPRDRDSAVPRSQPESGSSSASLAVVILAAGEGTRMRSAQAKVLHGFAGRSMLGHVLAAVDPLDPDAVAVVVGHQREHVIDHLAAVAPGASAVVQEQQNGTGHAVRVALSALAPELTELVLVLPGDAPLLSAETLGSLVRTHRAGRAAATLLTSRVADPFGYGRVVRAPDGSVARVVEQKDATEDELQVDEVSALVYVFDGPLLRDAVTRLNTRNAQGEEYLPDVVAILVGDGHPVAAVIAPAQETAGVNDRVQLAAAHATYRARLLEQHMRAGVTIVDPNGTWIDADVTIAPDVTILPGVHLLAGTSVDTGATIGPDCTITATTIGAGASVTRSVTDGAAIGPGSSVGPYAYLRPGAHLVDHVKVGTFVEVKNSELRAGSKVPHLSYVGDATIGERSNIGASTMFANYDGRHKNRSVIGNDVKISCDTTIVAPVTIGDGAFTGAGTVVREDVPPGALAVSMGKQRSIDGWAARRNQASKTVPALQSDPASQSDPALQSDPADSPKPKDP